MQKRLSNTIAHTVANSSGSVDAGQDANTDHTSTGEPAAGGTPGRLPRVRAVGFQEDTATAGMVYQLTDGGRAMSLRRWSDMAAWLQRVRALCGVPSSAVALPRKLKTCGPRDAPMLTLKTDGGRPLVGRAMHVAQHRRCLSFDRTMPPRL